MKINYILLFIFLSVFSFAQNGKGDNNDLQLRQAMAAKYLKENSFDYKTGEAKAAHNILLEAFTKNSVVVNITTENIPDAGDKANVISLIGGLNSILVLTPTWQDLVKLEKQKVLFEDRALNRNPQLLENKAQQK
ncbi:MAG: hypothetical protein K0S32_4075 [Bacteroidetes bacterium]|jgi:hypothetical protein|nr:hypothetical protein [Bacteroidota bacterium]